MIGSLQSSLPKRFYKTVEVQPKQSRYAILLDGREVKTPGQLSLSVPTKSLAEAMAMEWQAQSEVIDLRAMPLTGIAYGAIDVSAEQSSKLRADIVRFSSCDLLCYRVAHPPELNARQALLWDPVLHWVEKSFDAVFYTVTGIIHVEQPDMSLNHISKYLESIDPFCLPPLHIITTLTGSAFLALAVESGYLRPDEAWQAALVDEQWQVQQWGPDAEAVSAKAHRKASFHNAVQFLDLARRIS